MPNICPVLLEKTRELPILQSLQLGFSFALIHRLNRPFQA